MPISIRNSKNQIAKHEYSRKRVCLIGEFKQTLKVNDKVIFMNDLPSAKKKRQNVSVGNIYAALYKPSLTLQYNLVRELSLNWLKINTNSFLSN